MSRPRRSALFPRLPLRLRASGCLAGSGLLSVTMLAPVAAEASAEDGPRVVVIDGNTERDASSEVSRLSAELSYAGYDVVFDPPEGDVNPLHDLARSVVELTAVAGIWLGPDQQVWVSTFDPNTVGVLIREFSVMQDDPEFIALRVVELVESSLQFPVLEGGRAGDPVGSAALAPASGTEGERGQGNRWRCEVEQAVENGAYARCRKLRREEAAESPAMVVPSPPEDTGEDATEPSSATEPSQSAPEVDPIETDTPRRLLPLADLAVSYGYRWGRHYEAGNIGIQGSGRLGARRRLLAGAGLSWAAPPGRVDAETGATPDTGDDAIRIQQLEALALFGFQGAKRGSSGTPSASAGFDRVTARLVLGLGAAVLFGRNEINGREDRTAVARVTLQPSLGVLIWQGLSIDLGGTLELSTPGVSVVGGAGSLKPGVVAGGVRLGLRWTFNALRE